MLVLVLIGMRVTRQPGVVKFSLQDLRLWPEAKCPNLWLWSSHPTDIIVTSSILGSAGEAPKSMGVLNVIYRAYLSHIWSNILYTYPNRDYLSGLTPIKWYRFWLGTGWRCIFRAAKTPSALVHYLQFKDGSYQTKLMQMQWHKATKGLVEGSKQRLLDGRSAVTKQKCTENW